jgi:hypothetical protein
MKQIVTSVAGGVVRVSIVTTPSGSSSPTSPGRRLPRPAGIFNFSIGTVRKFSHRRSSAKTSCSRSQQVVPALQRPFHLLPEVRQNRNTSVFTPSAWGQSRWSAQFDHQQLAHVQSAQAQGNTNVIVLLAQSLSQLRAASRLVNA